MFEKYIRFQNLNKQQNLATCKASSPLHHFVHLIAFTQHINIFKWNAEVHIKTSKSLPQCCKQGSQKFILLEIKFVNCVLKVIKFS